jgi:hypothetical protein
MSLIEYIGSIGGISGVMAFIMFLVYRQDRKASEDKLVQLIHTIENRQTEIVRAYNETCRVHTAALVENTKMNSELMTWLKAKNGHG